MKTKMKIVLHSQLYLNSSSVAPTLSFHPFSSLSPQPALAHTSLFRSPPFLFASTPLLIPTFSFLSYSPYLCL